RMVNLSATSRTNRSRSVVVSPDEQHGFGVRYWEIIADNLSKAGWSWGCVSAIDSEGRTIWIVDAHRDDGKGFVARAEEKLTAFVELESAIQATISCKFPTSIHGSRLWLGNVSFFLGFVSTFFSAPSSGSRCFRTSPTFRVCHSGLATCV